MGDANEAGLEKDKYVVKRSDGKEELGAKYYVLRYDRNHPWDQACRESLMFFCERIKQSHPKLAAELAQEVDDYTYVPLGPKTEFPRFTKAGDLRCTVKKTDGGLFELCQSAAENLVTFPAGRDLNREVALEPSIYPACQKHTDFWKKVYEHAVTVRPITDENAVKLLFCKTPGCKSGALSVHSFKCPDCLAQAEYDKRPKKTGFQAY